MPIRNHALPKTGALLLAVIALPAIMSGQAVRDVKVVNTPNVHVTNTPSVTVANTPTVNVGNTPSVNVSNTPNVSIANTAAKPAVVSNIDDPGRIPYQSTVDNSNKCSGTSCLWTFGAPAPGHRVVIQHVTGLADFNASPNAVSVLLNDGSGAFVSSFLAPINGSLLFTAFDQPVQAYFESTQLIQVQVNVFGTTFSTAGTTQSVTVSGYQVDCTAAPCTPVAH